MTHLHACRCNPCLHVCMPIPHGIYGDGQASRAHLTGVLDSHPCAYCLNASWSERSSSSFDTGSDSRSTPLGPGAPEPLGPGACPGGGGAGGRGAPLGRWAAAVPAACWPAPPVGRLGKSSEPSGPNIPELLNLPELLLLVSPDCCKTATQSLTRLTRLLRSGYL